MDPIIPLKTLMGIKFPEQQWIVDRIIPSSAITILSGQPKSFKTYTLLYIAMCVSQGEPLFGEFSTEKTNVLIIDEENEPRLIQHRLKQLGADEESSIHFTPRKGFNIGDETIDNVLLSCQTYDIKLVIIDSLIRIHRLNENSSGDMAEVFKQLRRFTEAGIAVLVTQHHRKPGSNYTSMSSEIRGSSDILAAIDSHMSVTRQDKYYLTFEQTKQRYEEELEPFEIKINIEDDNLEYIYIGETEGHINKTDILRSAVAELLKEHGKLLQKELLQKLEITGVKTNEHKLRPLLNRWISEGLLDFEPGKGNSKYYKVKAGAEV